MTVTAPGVRGERRRVYTALPEGGAAVPVNRLQRNVCGAVAGLLLPSATLPALAQTFPIPGRPIRIVVGFAAGGGTDIQARLVAPRLAEALGAPVVVENRPGASTMIAAQEVAQAAPDGHTLLYTFSGTFTQNPHLFANVPYALRDFTPISLGALGPLVLVAHVGVPARDVAELVAWAKAKASPIDVASFGTGTSSHVFAELFARQAGIAVTHVPYKGGGDAAKDLIAGRVQLMFDAAPSALQHARNGHVRILAVVAETRSPFLPDVPTLRELGYRDLDIVGGVGFFGPARLPAPIVARLNAALVKALASSGVRDGFANGAYEAVSSSPEALDDLMKRGHQRWGRIVRELGMKPM